MQRRRGKRRGAGGSRFVNCEARNVFPVVEVNFINLVYEAGKRDCEFLAETFDLFEGVFGVYVGFEKHIA